MPYKPQSECFRDGGALVNYCDGYSVAHAVEIAASIRRQGFRCRRDREQVFVRPEDLMVIQSDTFDDAYRALCEGAVDADA